MPKRNDSLLKYLLAHLAYGLTGGLTFGLAVLATNLSNIRTLALESAHPVLIIGLMFFGLFVTFGSVGMGVGIMSLPKDDDDD